MAEEEGELLGWKRDNDKVLPKKLKPGVDGELQEVVSSLTYVVSLVSMMITNRAHLVQDGKPPKRPIPLVLRA